MACPDGPKRLIVNADDFGRSSPINEAVIRAHRDGILTTASLMVNEPGFQEAVELARQNPRLGVGLHLTLVCGHSTLGPDRIPGLVDVQARFDDHPARSGFRYFAQKSLRAQLGMEIDAQFQKFRQTGFPLDHVNGHLHFHLHPAVFKLLQDRLAARQVRHFRLTRDPLRLNFQLASGRWCYRLSHALILSWLARRAEPVLHQLGIRHTGAVFGLLQNDHVNEAFLMKLLPRLPAGDSELYSHPSLDEAKSEFEALISPQVKALLERLGIQRIRYQDL